MNRNHISLALLFAAFFALSSCGKSIPPSAQAKTEAPVTVQTTIVVMAPMAATLKATGSLEGIREAMLQSETQGRVLGIMKTTGDRVAVGTPILKVDDELKVVALRQAEAARQSAEAALEKAQIDLKRTQQLVSENAATKNQAELAALQVKGAQAGLKGAEAGESLAKRQLNDATVKAPISGIISMRYVNQGEMLAPGARVASIVDDSRMKLRINVNESDIVNVRSGDVVNVHVDAINRDISGRVGAISAKADMAHAYEVEVDLPNNGLIKSGMFARAEIQRNTPRVVPVVPNEALIATGAKTQVYIVTDGVAHLRAIKTGAATNEKIEIVEGLQSGDQVVTFGQNQLHDGAHVKL